MTENAPTPPLEEWLTTTQAAELAGYHVNHIRRLLQETAIEGRRWGNAWMVSRASLTCYLERMENRGGRRGPKPKDTA